MTKQGNILISDNNSDTIDNIQDVLSYIIGSPVEGSLGHSGERLILQMVHNATESLKNSDKTQLSTHNMCE